MNSNNECHTNWLISYFKDFESHSEVKEEVTFLKKEEHNLTQIFHKLLSLSY
jgi:hypothetical protein